MGNSLNFRHIRPWWSRPLAYTVEDNFGLGLPDGHNIGARSSNINGARKKAHET
jgi:hypothetical protein